MDMSYFDLFLIKKKKKKLKYEPQSHFLANTQRHQIGLRRDLSAAMNRELGSNFQNQKKKKKTVTLVEPLLTYLYANYISPVVTFFNQ